MSTTIIRTEQDRRQVIDLLSGLSLEKPYAVNIHPYKRDRSAEQNKLAFQWYTDAARHTGDVTEQEIRTRMKLEIGIPILRGNDAFRKTYDSYLKRYSYEEKLEIIERMDIPVTRLMSIPQMTEYLDTMQRYWAKQGLVLEGEKP